MPVKHYEMSEALTMLYCSVTQSCLTLRDPMDCSPPGSCPWDFSSQEYGSGLPFPPTGDLPDPGIEPGSAVLRQTLSSKPPGKPSSIWGIPYLFKIFLINIHTDLWTQAMFIISQISVLISKAVKNL